MKVPNELTQQKQRVSTIAIAVYAVYVSRRNDKINCNGGGGHNNENHFEQLEQ